METVRYWRKRKGWTQSDLAEEAGLTLETVSNVEIGRHEPRPSTLRKLARALGVEVADLFLEPDSLKAAAPQSLQERLQALSPAAVRRLLRGREEWAVGTVLEERAVANRLEVSREELVDLLVQAEPQEARRLLVGTDEDEDDGTLVYLEILREGNIDDAEKWRRLSAFREVA